MVSHSSRRLTSIAAVFLLTSACGEDPAPPAPPPMKRDAGTRDSGTPDAQGSDAAVADGEVTDSGLPGPLVKLEAPTATDDPASDDVILDGTVEVFCVAEDNPDGDEVRGESVEITLTSLEGEMKSLEGVVTTSGSDRHRAVFNLAGLPNGEIEIVCTAEGIRDGSALGQTSLRTFYDPGPGVQIIEPTEGQTFARLQTTVVQVEVKSAPLAKGDEGADVSEVRFQLNGAAIPENEIVQVGTEYRFEIDFDDATYFQEDSRSAMLVVEAEDARGAVRRLTQSMGVDPLGPSITFLGSVTDGKVLGGEQTVRVEVTDEGGAGVDPAQVRVRLNGKAFTMTQTGDEFRHTFSTLEFGATTQQVTIQVDAKDLVGNLTSEDVQIYLDTIGPWISMDPPTWRAAEKKGERCSPAFDPVGEASGGGDVPMPNDGDTRPPNVVLRALVYEQTNQAAGATSVRYSGVDDSTVEVYVQRDLSTPLLIDDTPDDGDDRCTAVHRDVPAGETKPDSLNMTPLEPSSYGNNVAQVIDYTPTASDPADLLTCKAAVEDKQSESTCGQTPRFIPRHNGMVDDTPIVYAINPTGPKEAFDCRGIAPNLEATESGWVCLVVRAQDHAGNVSFSPPHRVCVDKNWPTTTDACDGIPMPSCTDGCIVEDPKSPPSQVSRWSIEPP